MKKQRSNKTIAILVIIIIILIVLLIGFSMQARTIKVEGNEQYTDEQIKDYIFKDGFDRNILILWIKTKMGVTETIPFVEKYDIEILSYDKVRVTIYEKSIVGYIDYMGNYMYFDKDGMVVESSPKKIDGVPKVTGIDFDYILLHEPLPVENPDVFDLLLTVTQTMNKYDIEVKRIYISQNMEITLYKGNVKILLGTEKDLSEKMSDLSAMISKLEGYSGTLDMTVLDTEGDGYTLKRDVE